MLENTEQIQNLKFIVGTEIHRELVDACCTRATAKTKKTHLLLGFCQVKRKSIKMPV